MPTARGGIVGAPIGRFVVVFGGEAPEGTFDEAEAFDTVERRWTSLPPMPTPRHGLAAATMGDRIFVIGGGEIPMTSVGAANEVLHLNKN